MKPLLSDVPFAVVVFLNSLMKLIRRNNFELDSRILVNYAWGHFLIFYTCAVVLYARPLVHYKSSDSKAYLRKIEPGSDAEVFLNRD